MEAETSGNQVTAARRCLLRSVEFHWDFAQAHRSAIDAHWERRTCENPAFFNGTVHLLGEYFHDGTDFRASLKRVAFKDFLYWKDMGYPDKKVFDVFGSALLRSAEGHVILGRQSAGNLNAGLAYLPGGFIDERDVAPDGTIDIMASIGRELLEETGLGTPDIAAVPGFMVTRCGQLVSIAAEFRSPSPSGELLHRIRSSIAEQAEAELAGVVRIAALDDLVRLDAPPYVHVLMSHVFQGNTGVHALF